MLVAFFKVGFFIVCVFCFFLTFFLFCFVLTPPVVGAPYGAAASAVREVNTTLNPLQNLQYMT